MEIANKENAYGKNWELLKFELRKIFMKMGATLQRNKKEAENKIMTELISLSSLLPENLSEAQRAELQTLQLQLDQLYIGKAKGAFIRSRAKWLEEGEQNSGYFFKLEKQRQNQNSMTRLSLNNTIVDKPEEISQICEDYYKTLYQSEVSAADIDSFFNTLGGAKTIGEADKKMCDSDVTITDIENAIKKLKVNKSPGVDGLTSEFYRLFHTEISPFLLNVIMKV